MDTVFVLQQNMMMQFRKWKILNCRCILLLCYKEDSKQQKANSTTCHICMGSDVLQTHKYSTADSRLLKLTLISLKEVEK